MTLLDYISSLQDQGLTQEEIFAKGQEWKKNNTQEEPVEEEEAEDVEVKTNDSQTKDPSSESEDNTGSESEDGSSQQSSYTSQFTDGVGISSFQKTERLKSYAENPGQYNLTLDELNAKLEPEKNKQEQEAAYTALTQVAKPNETYTKGGYEYKYSFTPEGPGYYARKKGSDEWKTADEIGGDAPVTIPALFKHNNLDTSLHYKNRKLIQSGNKEKEIKEFQGFVNQDTEDGIDPALKNIEKIFNEKIKLTPEEILKSNEKATAFAQTPEIEFTRTEQKINKFAREGTSGVVNVKKKYKVNCAGPDGANYEECNNWRSTHDAAVAEVAKDKRISRDKLNLEDPEVQKLIQQKMIAREQDSIEDKLEKRKMTNFIDSVPSDFTWKKLGTWMYQNTVNYSIGGGFVDAKHVWSRGELQRQMESYQKDKSLIVDKKINKIGDVISKAKIVTSALDASFKAISEGNYQTELQVANANKALQNINKQRQEVFKVVKEQYKLLDASIEERSDIEGYLGKLEKNYSVVPIMINNAENSAIEMGQGVETLLFNVANLPNDLEELTGVSASVFNPVWELGAKYAVNGWGVARDKVNENINEYQKGIMADIADPMTFDDLETGGDWGRYLFATAGAIAPQMAVMVGTGGYAGLGTVVASAGGGKINMYEDEMKQSKKAVSDWEERGKKIKRIELPEDATQEEKDKEEAFYQDQIKQWEESKPEEIHYNKWQMWGGALTTMGAEFAGGKLIALPMINRAKAFKGLGVKPGFTREFGKKFLNKSYGYFGDLASEGAEEVFAEGAGNLYDRMVLDKDVNIFDGWKDNFFSGVMMANGFKTPGLFAPYINSASTPGDQSNIKGKQDDIKRDIDIMLQNPKMSQKTKDLMNNNITQNTVEIQGMMQNIMNRYSDMPRADIDVLGNIELESFKIDQQIEAVKNDDGIEVGKEKLLDELQNQKNALTGKKNQLLEPYVNVDAEGQVTGGGNLIAPKSRKIQEGADVVANQLGDTDITRFDTTEDLIGGIETLKAQGINVNVQLDADGNIEDAANQSYGLIATLPDGTQQVIINNASSEADGVLPADKHEILHAFAAKMDPAKLAKMGKDLKAKLDSDPNIKIDVETQSLLNDYEADLNSGKINEATFYEEVMAVTSDALTSGGITITEPGKLKTFLNSFLETIGWKQSFKDGDQVIDFLKGFNKDVISGKGLSQQTLDTAGVNLESQQTDTTTKESKKTQQNIEQEAKVNAVVEQDADGNFTQTKKEWDEGGADKAIDKLVRNQSLDQLIKSKFPSNVPGISLDDFVQQTTLELIPHIRNFNPEINDSLSGWINSQLSNKVGNTLKSGKAGTKDAFEVDVTEAKSVASDSQTDAIELDEVVVTARKKSPKGDAVYGPVLTENLGTDVAPAIETAIQSDLKTTPIANMAGTRNIGPALGKTLGKAFGLNPEVFTIKSRNIAKGDLAGLTNLRQYLTNNAQSDFSNLPDAYDSKGKSTFIPNSILESLYIKDGKGKWKLDPSKTLNDYKNLIGEVDSKKPIYRSKDATIAKGLAGLSFRNKMFETAFPKAELRVGTGVKFSNKPDKKQTIKKQQEDIVESFGAKVIKKGRESVTRAREFMTNGMVTGFGDATTLLLKPSTFAAAGNNIASALKRGFLAINDASRASKNKQDSIDAVKNGDAIELKDVKEEVNQKTNIKNLDKDTKRDIQNAVGSQKGAAKALKNQGQQQSVLNGKNFILNGIRKIVLNNKFDIAGLQFMLGNQNANAGLARNMATINNDGRTNKKGKAYEEHWFPMSAWATNTLKASGLSDAVWNGWKKFSNDNYYQEIVNKDLQENFLDKTYDVKMEDGSTVKWNSKSDLHPVLQDAINKGLETGDFSLANKLADIRKYPGKDVHTAVNPFTHGRNGVSDAVRYDIIVGQDLQANPNIQHATSSLINEIIIGKITPKQAQERIDAYETTAKDEVKSSKKNNKTFGDKVNPDSTIEDQIKDLGNYDKAAELGRALDTPTKGISVFDFDDTLAKTKETVIVNMPDGKSKEISAAEFAKEASTLEAGGATFDFSNFDKVSKGTAKGPLADLALKRQDKFGSKDIFVLTARPQVSASAIQTFLDGIGLNIPISNITGLADGNPAAKGRWVASKAAEGYNDFYFADDAVKNVKAVKEVLDQIDVKSDVQIAKQSKKKTFDKIFNDIIESSTGIETFKDYSRAKAKTVGKNKGKFSFFTTPSAEDFLGLLYKTLGKGKVGDAQLDFYKKNLLDTYDRAELATTRAKIQAAADFKKLKSNLKTLPKSLSKEMGYGGFTHSQAARVATWTRQGMTIPGLSKTDLKALNDFVDKNAEMNTLVDELMKIQKGKEYPAPGENWLAGSITTDVLNGITKVNRKQYLQEWQENVDIIFSDKNMNKLEAAYGPKYVEALRDQLRRMKSGSNRPIGGSRVVNNVLDWLNNSVGAIMFLNTRSAVLQTLSAVNFIGVGNNGLINSAKAFANQKQYWTDFKTLMNSPYLVERRNGLKINVSESEIADAVAESADKPKAALSYLLNKGFVLTRFADSFAIATGGAGFYRNQLDMYVKQGMPLDAAKKQAFEDFYSIAEKNQQSSNPSKISQQQASGAGRVILAFANTPMQYARIIKRSSQDLINGRGDWKKNVGTIAFYGVAQNLIFNAMQNALFADAFGEEEEEEKDNNKTGRIANGMADSLLAGLGIQGKAALALKNSLITLAKENDKKSPKFVKAVYDLFDFSPPLDSKFRKLRSAANTFTWDRQLMKEKGFSLDNPAYLAGAQVISGLTNLPLDRAIQKINNIRGIMSEQSQNWQKVALALGWSTWDVGLGYYGGFDKKEPLTEDQQYDLDVATMKKDTSTKQQKQMLLDLGVTRQELKKLKYEEDRVKKIIELQKKKKDK